MDTLGKLLRTHPSEAPVLTNVLLTDTDHSIRAAAAGGLGNLSLPASAPSMQAATDALRAAAISDEHFIVRYSAIVALGNVGDVTSIGLLVPLVDSTLVPALEAVAAIDALGEIVKETPSLLGDMNAAKKAVLGRSTDKEDLVRAAVARALFEWKQAVSHGAETAESDDNVRFTGALNDMLKNEEQNGQSTFVLGLLQKLLECDSNSD